MRAYRSMFVISALTALSVGLIGAPASADDDPLPASNVLTAGSAGGTAVAVGDVLNAAVATGTTADFATTSGGTTGIKCAQSAFTATVVDNPVAPGVATESATAHTFASCTANILGVTRVNSVTVNNLPFTTTVESITGTVTVSGTDAAPIQTTLNLGTILGSVTCVYRANGNAITGVSANDDNSIAFANQAFAKSSGPVTCPANGYFTARYAPVLDTTAEGTPAVYTN
ncbi:Tat pathway signal sequence domain protein [Actinoplanes sp. TFC3]|uniref:Tat pathway signal sequence domain protein n=1 Tax=Actinoplanes sp. TFC3 TaxID=1710355 RepID=UPI00083479A2|nr:Tat pathway signal sequence domain protein [Actinoplanes sp. TFC3]